MYRLLKSPIFLLFALFTVFGATYFVLNYFAYQQAEHTSPDGNYKIIVYQYPIIGSFFSPYNDGPGFIRFHDLPQKTNTRFAVSSVNSMDSIKWHFDSVDITDSLIFPLSLDYQVVDSMKNRYADLYLAPAVESGNLERVKQIVNKGVFVNNHDFLQSAVTRNDTALTGYLLAQPGYLEYINSLSSNVMNDSIAVGNTDMIQLLIELGVSTNFIKRNGLSPLLAAAAGGNANTILMLLKNDVNVSCYSGKSKEFFNNIEKKYQWRIRALLKKEKLRCWAFEDR